MITKFDDFLNESEESRKRISDLINKSFDRIRSEYNIGKSEEPLKSEPPKLQPLKPEPLKSKRELKLKPIKVKGLNDKRLVDAMNGLISTGYDKTKVLDFLKNIEEIYPETTTEEIIRFAMKNNCTI